MSKIYRASDPTQVRVAMPCEVLEELFADSSFLKCHLPAVGKGHCEEIGPPYIQFGSLSVLLRPTIYRVEIGSCSRRATSLDWTGGGIASGLAIFRRFDGQDCWTCALEKRTPRLYLTCSDQLIVISPRRSREARNVEPVTQVEREQSCPLGARDNRAVLAFEVRICSSARDTRLP